jgi:2-polyprenyl-3-methyl-5-hydroxy-6-metoxy-1,4-benzoquinol methylase
MLSWSNYWKEDPKLFMTVMEKSTEYVAKKLESSQLIDTNTRLFDFGCGPGYLATALKGKIKEYHGVDISQRYITTAKEKCKGYPTFDFSEIPFDNTHAILSNFEKEGKRFDTIVILSVIQYFPTNEAVLQLLEKCKELMAEGGKIILADVIEHENGIWKDAFNVLFHSIKKRYLLSFLKFIIVAKQSKYNQLRKKHRLLQLTKEEVTRMANELSLQLTILPSITIQSSRISYCLVS